MKYGSINEGLSGVILSKIENTTVMIKEEK
jgi:hypothetical protein